jgi:beta-mannosidase
MIRILLILALAGLTPAVLHSGGQTTTEAKGPGVAPETTSLDGTWRLTYFPQGKYRPANPDQLRSLKLQSIEAAVPGNVELDLSRKGELPADLYFGDNILKLRPYELNEWWYQREFLTPAGIGSRRVELFFGGVDCLATYWLNGKELGSSDNMLIEQRFDVTGKLSPAGPNVLTIRLRSATLEAATKKYDPSYSITPWPPNVASIWIRKAAHSYGWDIMPRAVSAGIWRCVQLVIHPEHEIEDIQVNTLSVSQSQARLAVFYQLNTDLSLLPDLKLRIEGRCGQSTFSEIRKVYFSAGRFTFDVKNPQLWWPRGYGRPDLYEITTQLLYKDKVLAARRDAIGIRTVELVRTEVTSLERPGQFLFKVNNVPILAKGSNWVPADAFHSRDADRYEKILSLFADLGCNMLRAWGGNVYEDHAFFDICDRNGIMVWQDFSMACAVYPQTPEFLEVMRKEALSVVRKLRIHPSIVLWSGDNEVDMFYYRSGLDPGHNRITREVLPQVVAEADPYRPYLPSSPYWAPEVVASHQLQLMPEDHLWGPRDYYKSRFYTEHTAHFVSEIGYHGCPNLSSLKRFLEEKYLWPWQDNPQWILHSTDMTGSPNRSNLMAKQTKEMFGEVPESIDDFILASQSSQAEANKFFVEMTRLKKWRRTGLTWWNVIDGWPQFSDAVVDYYFNKKLAYYYLRRVQQPVCIMIDEPSDWHVRVVAGNDSLRDAKGKYRVWDADSGETLLEGQFATKANENSELGRISISHSDKKLLLMEWTVDGNTFGNHYLLGFPPFSLGQYKKWLTKIAALETRFDAETVGK